MADYQTFTVIFFTRKHRENINELFIYARITVDGKRTELSLKRSIPVNHWDASKGRARGNTHKIRLLNGYLDQVYSKFLECHTKLVKEDRIISPQAIKSFYLGRDENYKSLKDIIAYHNTFMVSVLQHGTMKNYYTTEKYLNKFLNEILRCEDIYLKNITYRFITDFEHFLRTYKPKKARRTCGNNGTMKHLERLRKMINLAVKLEWISKNPFENYQLRFKKNERHYLNDRELEIMEQTTFTNPSLQKVKDIFVFSCYTGLSYIDLKELNRDQIIKGIDGNDWIYTKRIKTNETVKIPLLFQAREIIAQYRENAPIGHAEFVLPLFSNQKINDYLKEITASLGIRKNITFHSARHTFATTVTLANGVPIETVSKLLGHTKLSTTQIYARVLEKKISSDMGRLEKSFQKRNSDARKCF